MENQKRPGKKKKPAPLLRTEAPKRDARASCKGPKKKGELHTKLIQELQIHQIELEMQNGELRRVQMELDTARMRYFDLYDMAPVGYFTLSEKGVIRGANLTAARLLGETRGAITRQPISRFILPKDMDIYRMYRKRLIETGTQQVCEIRMVEKNGRQFWARMEASIQLDASGKPEIRAILSDISKRHLAEEALKAISDRYRSYIEVTGELGWTTDADGKVVEDLPSWRNYTGQTYEEIQGLGWSKALHPEDLKSTVQIWQKAVTEKSGYEVDYRIRRHDGVYRHFMVRGMPVLNDNGGVREWIGTCIDITARKESEDSLQRLNQELLIAAEKLRIAYNDIESFSYSASHDLTEPLLIIDWFSNNILKKYGKDLDAGGIEMLTTIRTTSKRMMQLIESLLSFSRVSTRDVVKSDIDMRELTESVLGDMKSSVEKRSVTFRVGDLPPAWADPSMVRQVLVNLLSNALKYARTNGKVIIEITGMRQKDEIVYSIKDNGIGFDMKLSGKLFGYFKRLHSSTEVSGIGIGLAIVKNIIRKHGGRVWAEGKPDEGATFYFTLPEKNG